MKMKYNTLEILDYFGAGLRESASCTHAAHVFSLDRNPTGETLNPEVVRVMCFRIVK